VARPQGVRSLTKMKCIDCKFLSEPKTLGNDDFPAVRCTLGLWDKDNPIGAAQWYAYGSAVRNRGPVRKHGENCKQGEPN